MLASNRLLDRCGSELFYHGQKQLAIALVQIGGVAADLGKKAQFFVAELLCIQLMTERVSREELSDGQIERFGDLCQRVEGWNRVTIFYAR